MLISEMLQLGSFGYQILCSVEALMFVRVLTSAICHSRVSKVL